MTFDIEYNGKSIKTKNWEPVTDEELAKYRNEYYARPDKSLVLKQMQKINTDGVMMDKITRYYFRDLMAQTLHGQAKWTVDEVLNSVSLCGIFKAKVNNSPRVFDPEKPMGYNIERAIALGGKGYAKVPTQFPVKAADAVYELYNVNNKVYDFSCGWGARLVSALKHKLEYYGTDPNYILCERLEALAQDWATATKYTPITDIRAHGSEIFVPEWENTFGLAFSSPPYFSLEDYKIGQQSYAPGITIDEWTKNYVIPTIKNIHQYLISDGILAINIKDTEYPLVQIFSDAIEQNNFQFIEKIELKNIKRLKSTGGLTDTTDEGIYIFKNNRGN